MSRQLQLNGGVHMKWIAAVLFCGLLAGHAAADVVLPVGKQIEPGVLLVGKIEHPRLTESSGLVASRKAPAVFWSHSDGGGRRQVLYALTREGRPLGEYRVSGVMLEDWEDIATDDAGHLFLADTGNNDAKPVTLRVHQVSEPDLKASTTGLAPVTRTWNLHYPAAPFDCESLFVWKDDGFLISKVSNDARANIYRFSLTNSAPAQTLAVVGEIKIDSPVTGADLSHDGNLLGLVAKNGAYVFRVQGDIARALKGRPHHHRFKADQIEGCTFVPEGLLTTAESREIYLFTDEAFRTGPKKK
jgi:hypothetical protein